ncbi:MAG: glutamate--tRNA ligase [Candidatus Omnitrophota bacterium]
MVRVRFAPSPTGRLHIGNARTALFNWIFARKAQGRFILRIEDTDIERSQKNFVQEIFADLKWLGIDWDEGPDIGGEFAPYVQSQRIDIYKQYLDKLKHRGRLYECYCRAEELEERREKLLQQGKTSRYDNRCRNLTEEEKQKYRSENRIPVLRFKVPDNREIIIDDLIRGRVQFNTSVIGDFVVQKSDGYPMFNFAVCVDDYLMQITHILRGEDHLSNTPRHILIFESLGAHIPQFAHMSMTMGEGGEKLSKRVESVSIDSYRARGYLPEALFNYLVLLGWAPKGEKEILSKPEIISDFAVEDLNKSQALFDPAKLDWISGHYIRSLEIEQLTRMCIPYLVAAGFLDEKTAAEKFDRVKQVVLTVKERLKKIKDILLYADIFFREILTYNNEAQDILKNEEAKAILTSLVSGLSKSAEEITVVSFKALMKEVQTATGIKGKNLYLPVRVALTGDMQGPELTFVLPLLGKEVCLKRMGEALKK